jgi:hypothetical protein
MLLRYFLNDFEVVPVAAIVTGITFVFTFHVPCVSIVRSSYFKKKTSLCFSMTFLFYEIERSLERQVSGMAQSI